jgi:murein L,D-transpeptidase YafK
LAELAAVQGIMLRILSAFAVSLVLTSCAASQGAQKVSPQGKADYVVVEKSGRTLTLWSEGKMIRSYPVLSLGKNPYGHKVFEGDMRTPEGLYLIDKKHKSQRFQKFLRISYPNSVDIAKAKSLGVEPGGQVGIHGDKGGMSGFFDRMNPNWTEGCVSVRNEAVAEIYDLVEVGTPILIKP